MTDWTFWVIAAGVLLLWWTLRNRGGIAEEAARRYLREGALVIDVRSAAEFGGGHVPGAINIPLSDLSAELPRQVADHDKVLLLHCLSGGRSAVGWHHARRLGYSRVFNLGSYRRAAAIVRSAA